MVAVAAEPQTTTAARFCRPKEMEGQRPGRAASSWPRGARGYGCGAAKHAATMAAERQTMQEHHRRKMLWAFQEQ